MARIRTIKPEFFRHETLFEAEQSSGLPLRLVFIGLFTCCDREGRFRWRPRQLKLDILPYDEIEFSHVLDALATYGFLVKYEVDGQLLGCIPSWSRHQYINNKENCSELPSPEEGCILVDEVIDIKEKINACPTRASRVLNAPSTRNQNFAESLYLPRAEGEREGEYGKDTLTKELTSGTSAVDNIESVDNIGSCDYDEYKHQNHPGTH